MRIEPYVVERVSMTVLVELRQLIISCLIQEQC